jgi:hypothetical protein
VRSVIKRVSGSQHPRVSFRVRQFVFIEIMDTLFERRSYPIFLKTCVLHVAGLSGAWMSLFGGNSLPCAREQSHEFSPTHDESGWPRLKFVGEVEKDEHESAKCREHKGAACAWEPKSWDHPIKERDGGDESATLKQTDGAGKTGSEKCLGQNGCQSAGDGFDDEKGKHGSGAGESRAIDEAEEEVPEEEKGQRGEKHEAKRRSRCAAGESEDVVCVEVGGSRHCDGRNSAGDESECSGGALRDDVEAHEFRGQKSYDQNPVYLSGYGAEQIGTPCTNTIAEKKA